MGLKILVEKVGGTQALIDVDEICFAEQVETLGLQGVMQTRIFWTHGAPPLEIRGLPSLIIERASAAIAGQLAYAQKQQQEMMRVALGGAPGSGEQ